MISFSFFLLFSKDSLSNTRIRLKLFKETVRRDFFLFFFFVHFRSYNLFCDRWWKCHPCVGVCVCVCVCVFVWRHRGSVVLGMRKGSLFRIFLLCLLLLLLFFLCFQVFTFTWWALSTLGLKMSAIDGGKLFFLSRKFRKNCSFVLDTKGRKKMKKKTYIVWWVLCWNYVLNINHKYIYLFVTYLLYK